MTDTSGKSKGFKDGTNQTTEYVYDANGNMIADKNKGITAIEYNFLNLPKKVTFSASKYIEYTYDASGAKLSQKVVDGSTTKVSDYLGGFVYEDDKLQFPTLALESLRKVSMTLKIVFLASLSRFSISCNQLMVYLA